MTRILYSLELQETDEVGSIEVILWCNNGERHKFTMYFNNNGHSKNLPPNHMANAMVVQGRVTTLNFDSVDQSPNQELKESNGPNIFAGDVVIFVEDGQPNLVRHCLDIILYLLLLWSKLQVKK
jgi:hypothetical protein